MLKDLRGKLKFDEKRNKSILLKFKQNQSERKCSHSVVSDSLRPHGLQPTRFLRPWDFPGKNTGVGCHFFLQEIFPTQRLNPGLLHCRHTLYRLSHQGSPPELEYNIEIKNSLDSINILDTLQKKRKVDLKAQQW